MKDGSEGKRGIDGEKRMLKESNVEYHRKHRPRSWDDFIGQDTAIAQFKGFKKTPQALMLVGASGCGKTSAARVLRHTLGVAKSDYHEVNAASSRGIDTVRQFELVMAKHALEKAKMCVWDEAHKLTGDAQTALLKVLEDPARDAYYVLCTTDPDRLLKTIRTRCTKIEFRPVSEKDLLHLLRKVCKAEGLSVIENVLIEIAEAAEGGPRLALNLLNQIAGVEGVTEQLEIVKKTQTKKMAHELCSLLLFKQPKWQQVASTVEAMEQEPEEIRRVMLAYFAKIVLSGNAAASKAAAAYIYDIQDTPWDRCGKAGLVSFCYRHFSKK